MCGRYSIFTPANPLKIRFSVRRAEALQPTYNAAPTQDLPVILNSDPETIQLCRWGLIPSWAKEERIGSRMINARAETVETNNAYKGPFKSKRCLIPVDGFYEWKKLGGKLKQPYLIELQDKQPMAFAGLWEIWTPLGFPVEPDV